MRVQYTNKELELIKDKSYDAYIPFKYDNKIVTAGLKITDVYKFNVFIAKYLQDPSIKDQIGAELVHVDLHEPITRDKLINIHNFLGTLIYGDSTTVDNNTEDEYPMEDDEDEDYGEETTNE
jgi:hypothetical protein